MITLCQLMPGFHMICNGLPRSEAVVCVALSQKIVKHRRQMFPFKSEAIADKRTTNPLRSEEKKECTYFKSDWTCFKANNSVLPIEHRSSWLRHTFPSTIVLVGKVEPDSTFRSSRPCATDAGDISAI